VKQWNTTRDHSTPLASTISTQSRNAPRECTTTGQPSFFANCSAAANASRCHPKTRSAAAASFFGR
jgi:hypothetical protein